MMLVVRGEQQHLPRMSCGLSSAGGGNEAMNVSALPTLHKAASPFIRQSLASPNSRLLLPS